MIEELIQNFLSGRLSVPVRLTVPTPVPDRFVVLEKTGSGYEDGLYAATLAVQSYGPNAQRGGQGRHGRCCRAAGGFQL